jgi:HAUS augmin-like complex subunit 1
MTDLSSTAIFSPSVARQQLVAAKEWSYIDNWLNAKFSVKAVPPFERNAETLKALLALASANETSDEERDLLCKVETEAAHELEEIEKADPHADLIDALEDELTKEGQASLDVIASTAVLLNLPSADAENVARKIIDVQVASFNFDESSKRIIAFQMHLDNEVDRLNKLIDELQSEAFQPPPDTAKQTVDHTRKSKAITAKLPDMKKQIASLSASNGTPKPTIQDVQIEEGKFRELMSMVRELEASVKSYHGLPHDQDLARLEVETLKVELRDLTKRRDMLFEGLVERESP